MESQLFDAETLRVLEEVLGPAAAAAVPELEAAVRLWLALTDRPQGDLPPAVADSEERRRQRDGLKRLIAALNEAKAALEEADRHGAVSLELLAAGAFGRLPLLSEILAVPEFAGMPPQVRNGLLSVAEGILADTASPEAVNSYLQAALGAKLGPHGLPHQGWIYELRRAAERVLEKRRRGGRPAEYGRSLLVQSVTAVLAKHGLRAVHWREQNSPFELCLRAILEFVHRRRPELYVPAELTRIVAEARAHLKTVGEPDAESKN